MGYEKLKIVEKVNDAIIYNKYLYQEPYVNYKGNVIGGKEKYSEVIAGDLLKKIDYFKNISYLKRGIGYKVDHVTNRKKNSNRQEELFAIRLVDNHVEIGKLGEAIYYQMPLKPHRIKKYNGVGKIDLLSKIGDKAYIIEFKYGNNKETLLRTVLEIVYYYQWLWKSEFLKNFGKDLYGVRTENIRKAVLLGIKTRSYTEANEIKDGDRKNLKSLINKMEVEVFSINSKCETKRIF